MRDSELAVVLVHPDLLGTYGDRGNALALVRRATARGLRARVVEVVDGGPLPRSADVYLVGGSEDATQLLALAALRSRPGAAETLAGATCLAVCAGFQLLAREFTCSDGHRVAGLGVLDVTCGRLPGPRAVGEVVAEPIALPGVATLTGYENHQGGAVLGPGVRPLGRIQVGVGNGGAGTERHEGAVRDGVVATYLHGPVLVRNPDLADHLLARVVGPLPPFVDEAVAALWAERIAAARHHGTRA